MLRLRLVLLDVHGYQISDTETSSVNTGDAAVKVDNSGCTGELNTINKISPLTFILHRVGHCLSQLILYVNMHGLPGAPKTAKLSPRSNRGRQQKTNLMDRLAKRGESSKLLAEPHSINTGLLLVELI